MKKTTWQSWVDQELLQNQYAWFAKCHNTSTSDILWLSLAKPVLNQGYLLTLINQQFSGFVECAMNALPFQHAFKHIVLQHVLDQSHDHVMLLQEALKALTPDGRLIIFGMYPLHRPHVYKWITTSDYRQRIKPYWPWQLAKVLQNLGLRIVSYERMSTTCQSSYSTFKAPLGFFDSAFYVMITERHSVYGKPNLITSQYMFKHPHKVLTPTVTRNNVNG